MMFSWQRTARSGGPEPTQARHLKLLLEQMCTTFTHTPLTKESHMAKSMSMGQENIFPADGEA